MTDVASEIVRAAAAGAGVAGVARRLSEHPLEPDDRIILLEVLLRDAVPDLDPHPADLTVCAFVDLGYEEFSRRPAPTVLIDLREGALRKTVR